MSLKISFKTVVTGFLLILMISSCSWLRIKKDPDVSPDVPHKVIDPVTLQEKLIASNLEFEWINARTRINYRSPGTTASGTGRLVMVKDSLIWGTAAAILGIEIVRFAITPDSVRIINRYDRTYTSLPFSFLQKQTGHKNLTFSELQQMLAGNYPYAINRDFESRADSAFHQLYTDYGREHIRVDVYPESFKPAGLHVTREAGTQSLFIAFNDLQKIEGQWFPGQLQIITHLPQRMELRMTFQNINFEPVDNLSFDVPDSYERAH